MNNLFLIILFSLLSANSYSIDNVYVLDDSSQPKLSAWSVDGHELSDQDAVDYIDNDKIQGKAIKLSGYGLNTIFHLKNNEGKDFDLSGYSVLQLKLKYTNPFLIIVNVLTTTGKKQLIYSDLNINSNTNGLYLHTGLGSGYRNGQWQLVTRNLQKDLSSFLPSVKITSVQSIDFRGSGYLDDIYLLLSMPSQIILAKSRSSSWLSNGKSSYVKTVNDKNLGKVLLFNSSLIGSYMELTNLDVDLKVNQIFQWKIKTKNNFKLILSVLTNNGNVDIEYSTVKDINNINLSNNIIDNNWNVISRNIIQDFRTIYPTLIPYKLTGIKIMGKLLATDITALPEAPDKDIKSLDWLIYDDDPLGSYAKEATDQEVGPVIELYGDGLKNAFSFVGKTSSGIQKESEYKNNISWFMNFNEPFELVLSVNTNTVLKYIHYIPKPKDYVLVDGDNIFIGIGETSSDSRWHKIIRNLDDDLKKSDKILSYKSCANFVVRGSGKVGSIEFSNKEIKDYRIGKSSAVASVVLGQYDFNHNLPNLIDTNMSTTLGMKHPFGIVVDSNNGLYVTDSGNNRLLYWRSVPKKSSIPADIVFGKNKLNNPTGIFIRKYYMFIADTGNNRVLMFDLPLTEDSKPSVVLDKGFKNPEGVFYDGNRFFIADTGNNRVLMWNVLPKSNETPFDLVLGQSSTTGILPNKGGLYSNYNNMFAPSSVFIDDKGRLFVSDSKNNRVLIFKQVPTMNGWHADAVIGQNSFSDNKPNMNNKKPSNSSLFEPKTIMYSNNKLFITDSANNRVVFISKIIEDEPIFAEGVIGQNGFNESIINNLNGIPTSSSLFMPSGICWSDGVLFIADTLNNRVLIY